MTCLCVCDAPELVRQTIEVNEIHATDSTAVEPALLSGEYDCVAKLCPESVMLNAPVVTEF
eukprot:2410451-Rhodomonas_salina.1